MNRIDRLTAIIIFLQGRKYVSISDLAERYSISKRTAYRDLKALEEAGVPIGLEPGKGYFISPGYHLPPVMFSKNEATSLLAGERLMQRWQNTELGRSYKSALEKIRSVLPKEELLYFEALDKHIQSYPYKYIHTETIDDRIFSALRQAIIKKQVVELKYQRPYMDEITHRKVEPLGLLVMSQHWYLAAWCRMRNDYRMFRLDRIQAFHITSEKLPDPPVHTLQTYYEKQLNQKKEFTEVVLRFKKEVAPMLGDHKYRYGWAWEKMVGDDLEMTFLTSYPEYLAYWILIWGTNVAVVSPPEMRERMKNLSSEIAMHYSGNNS